MSFNTMNTMNKMTTRDIQVPKTWNDIGNGVGFNANVWSVVADSAGNVYAGGEFTSLSDGTPMNYISKLPAGTNGWTSIGDGVGGGFNNGVDSIAYDSANNIYAGGNFT